jgi:hypothetical protein
MTSVSGAVGDGRRKSQRSDGQLSQGCARREQDLLVPRDAPVGACSSGVYRSVYASRVVHLMCALHNLQRDRQRQGKAGERVTSFALLKRMMMPGFKARLTRSQRGV